MPVPLQGIGANLRARRDLAAYRCHSSVLAVHPLPEPRPGWAFPDDTHAHLEPLTAEQRRLNPDLKTCWTGCDGELELKADQNQCSEARQGGHDLRRAIYGPRDAKCTTCVRCGKLWWCPAPDSLMVPTTCTPLKVPDADGLVILAGLAWIEGVPDARIDQANEGLIALGMAPRAADFRKFLGLPEA